ncbi:hypothetical protein VB774_01025 [Pseudanabaena galeata UHCC 0370]|uniref:Uncharacterized protein n=1 Tax=Pseudanabaena galeata UHCC 0370 TaxID=3110310 RepID=A0ABU5TD25_9CYAN|nr:hypothetical protein [Pseudanabaena galeata UHCC 0370]
MKRFSNSIVEVFSPNVIANLPIAYNRLSLSRIFPKISTHLLILVQLPILEPYNCEIARSDLTLLGSGVKKVKANIGGSVTRQQ